MSENKRRNRRKADLIADILTFCGNRRELKTNIMYGVNLSYPLTKKYIALLLEKKLIVQDGDFFTTTEFGLEYLEIYAEIGRIRSILIQKETSIQNILAIPTQTLRIAPPKKSKQYITPKGQ